MKAMKKNTWHTVKNHSLAIYARDAGFDLAMYESYDKAVQDALRARAVKAALSTIQWEFEQQGFEVADIHSGVYVIALSNPLSIQYRRGRSQVIYIGMGNIMARLKSHFENKLFDFMLGLNGANFDFHFAQPARSGTSSYFKHVEHLMLDYFSAQYGGMDDKRRFPILNKNAGSNKEYSEGSDWWKKPLKAAGRRPRWEIKPTNYSDFAPLDGN